LRKEWREERFQFPPPLITLEFDVKQKEEE
ncbi:unnamed protein product, partial [marine sediment metagenome]